MSYPPPPAQPGQPYPPYQPGPPRPSGNRRVAVIIAVCAAVAVLLCVGCGAAGAVFYLRGDGGGGGASGSSGTTPTPPALTSAAPLSCAATPVTGQPNVKAVGMPDFSKAPRTGTATMQITTNLGPITIRMDRARTPCTVASFQHLADKKYFDQTKCHRLVTTGIFVLQCGDPSGTGTGGPDYQFADENLGARYSRGVVAMANAGPGTNGSQFFIVFQDSPLDPMYTPFGSVTSGIAVVDQVAAGGDDGSLANSAGGGHPKIEITFQTVTVT